MFGIGQSELLVVLLIVLLFFGHDKLPKLSKTLGESAGALREGFTDGKNDKSLKDISQEVSTSAREIKQSFNEIRHPFSATEPTEGSGYGQQDYGEKGNS